MRIAPSDQEVFDISVSPNKFSKVVAQEGDVPNNRSYKEDKLEMSFAPKMDRSQDTSSSSLPSTSHGKKIRNSGIRCPSLKSFKSD